MSVASLPALGPWAPSAERGPSLESIYRVSLTVDLCEGNKIISFFKLFHHSQLGASQKEKKIQGPWARAQCALVKTALTDVTAWSGVSTCNNSQRSQTANRSMNIHGVETYETRNDKHQTTRSSCLPKCNHLLSDPRLFTEFHTLSPQLCTSMQANKRQAKHCPRQPAAEINTVNTYIYEK